MPVNSIGTYEFPARDAAVNFGGAIVTYWNWEDHLMICAAVAFPFPPDMRFGDVIDQVFPGVYGCHPDFAKIDWQAAEWVLNGAPFKPNFDRSLGDNGLDHKCLVRFRTPGLDGIRGSAT